MRHVTRVGRGNWSSAATCRRARSMSSTCGGSDTTLADSATAASTLAYDIPPSISANSSPHRNNHEAASALRANLSGSSMRPRLNLRSVGLSKSAIATTLPAPDSGRQSGSPRSAPSMAQELVDGSSERAALLEEEGMSPGKGDELGPWDLADNPPQVHRGHHRIATAGR